jgi:hypothetical protein
MSNGNYGWRHPMAGQSPNYGNQKPFDAVATVEPENAALNSQKLDNLQATPVRLPPHLFIPEGAESLDLRVAADIAPTGSTPTLLMEFECPANATCHFISYAVFSDGASAANQEFIPNVDGRRVFPYQGDPQDNFKINLGLAPDLSNNSLIQCQLSIQPGDKLQWLVKNTNLVNLAMGVRMVGYIDRSMMRVQGRVGG